jgi:hypothetical protein
VTADATIEETEANVTGKFLLTYQVVMTYKIFCYRIFERRDLWQCDFIYLNAPKLEVGSLLVSYSNQDRRQGYRITTAGTDQQPCILAIEPSPQRLLFTNER